MALKELGVKPTMLGGGKIAAYNCDAIAFMDALGPGRVDLVVTDPPYLMGYKTNHRMEKNPEAGSREAMLQAEIKGDKGLDGKAFIRQYVTRLYSILKEDSAAFIFFKQDGPNGEDLLGFLKKECKNAGFKVANTIIWMKDNWTAGDLEGSFGYMYEPFLYCKKGNPKLRGTRYPDIWEFPRVPDAERVHPHQKPIPLLQRAIESLSDDGDLVFDGCAGSGSTGIAAHSLGRKSILIEDDPARFEHLKGYVGARAATSPLF